MPGDLFFRTEDIRLEEVLDYLVETDAEREVVDQLKSRSPVILRGSRGVGKSFLLRVAEAEMLRDIDAEKLLPVYVTFARASLISTPSPDRFLQWMSAKICSRIVRAASQVGLTLPSGSAMRRISGESIETPSRMELLTAAFEESWRSPIEREASIHPPDPEVIQDAVEDLCRAAGLRRIVLLVDEAAHIFIPDQQRQFFTLMRDLRSPYLAIKAAVYPGATAFGDTFQPNHDATTVSIDRVVTDDEYIRAMREMATKQDRNLGRIIAQHGEVFDTLAYAATGNPRILLKTLARTTPFNTRKAQEVLRSYYREEIWGEHSSLSERYPGHRPLIDWGRSFVERYVLPELYRRNESRGRETSSYLWVHRDAPQSVKEALRLLCYSGILQEGAPGIKGTRSELGTRHVVNLGCQFALAADPISYGRVVRRELSIRRMVEFGRHHSAYKSLSPAALTDAGGDSNLALETRLGMSSQVLDVTPFQKRKLEELGLETIGGVLGASEATFMQAKYVGRVRARQMQNAAVAAVLEYLSG
jgi:hypothetical protein